LTIIHSGDEQTKKAERFKIHADKFRSSLPLQKLSTSVIQTLCKYLVYKNVFSAIWGGGGGGGVGRKRTILRIHVSILFLV
jgi:hypothetical protein